MLARKLLLLAQALLLLATHSFAWGCKGHQVVALIAYDHLTPPVARKVEQILAVDPYTPTGYGGQNCPVLDLPAIAVVASWADEQRSREPATAPYHYVDIPLGAAARSLDLAAVCNAQCVTWAISHYLDQLKISSSPKARADALRYLIHFVGDIHQPLHGVDNADEGGNCVPVRYRSTPKPTNLHQVWDSAMIDDVSDTQSARAWATEIEEAYFSLRPGSEDPRTWAWESHDLAVKNAYDPLPAPIAADRQTGILRCADRMQPFPLEPLDAAYVAQAAPVIEQRLVLAGLRLARLLNQTLGGLPPARTR